jgi:hypothetical protein
MSAETEVRPCPQAGDMVLYKMPAEWRPELGIRTYPAVVLYPTNELVRALDVQVFTGLDPLLRYGWVYEGTAPGQWRAACGG